MTTRHNQPQNPHPLHLPGSPAQAAERADELVHLYRQALELVEREGLQPNPDVRAAVLAAAAHGVREAESGAKTNPPRQRPQLAEPTEQPPSCADAEQDKADALAGAAASSAGRGRGRGAAVGGYAVSSVDTVAKQPANKRAAANDARWKIRALGGLAALGLVGLLASRFLPNTAGYVELAQTLPPAPYQRQTAPRPEAFPQQAQPVTQAEAHAHAHATPADVPTPSPMSDAEQAAAANAAEKTDRPAAAATPFVRTVPANEAADAPLPVRRQAIAPEPQVPVAKGKPLPKQQQKTQPPDPQRAPSGQPPVVLQRPLAVQAPQSSAQPHRTEQAEAAAATSFMRGVPERAITDQTAGDPISDQMSVKRASQRAGGQAVGQAAEPFPSDAAWPAAKEGVRSAGPQAPTAPAAAPDLRGAPAVAASPVQPHMQDEVPMAESAQTGQPTAHATSDFSRDRLLMRRVRPASEQTQEMPQATRPQRMQQARAPEAAQEAMQASGQSKRGRLKQGLPASPAALGQADMAEAAALFAVASRGDVAGAQRALRAGVDINARDAEGRTALMHAAAQGQRDMVRYLLRRGANAALTDVAGRDAAAYARQGGHEGLAQALSGKP